MLVIEDFLLITLDPKLGLALLPPRAPRLEILCAAALLIDLAEHAHLHLDDQGLRANHELPVNHPLLDKALAVLHAQPHVPATALAALAQRAFVRDAFESLFHRDVVHRIRQWRWLLRRRTHYPLRSMQARNAAIGALRRAALATSVELRGLALLQLVELCGLLPRLLAAREHEAAERRLLALNHPDARDERTRILAALRAALLES